jgi:hypothetical protein
MDKAVMYRMRMLQMWVRAHHSAPLQKLMYREICFNRC